MLIIRKCCRGLKRKWVVAEMVASPGEILGLRHYLFYVGVQRKVVAAGKLPKEKVPVARCRRLW